MASNRIIFDSGAVSALAKQEEAIRVAARKALTRGMNLIIPTVVVAESTTMGNPRDAAVNRALKLGIFADCDSVTARAAAALRLGFGRRAGTIDAIIVATADRVPGSVILTGDVGDIKLLAQVRGLTAVVAVNDL
jgi:hypothetical protein